MAKIRFQIYISYQNYLKNPFIIFKFYLEPNCGVFKLEIKFYRFEDSKYLLARHTASGTQPAAAGYAALSRVVRQDGQLRRRRNADARYRHGGTDAAIPVA